MSMPTIGVELHGVTLNVSCDFERAGIGQRPSRIVGAMTAFDLIRPVVRLRPLAVLKG
jgi:hypothetical protein